MNIREETEAFQRGALEDRRERLTDKQRAFLEKIEAQIIAAHGSVTQEHVLQLIDLCDRTLAREGVR